ncbi:MAG: hypothetical protein COB66_05630 [Coxiella sp. (in: Bacteria)]|nr:MAG: hypothetical protein COB66_05630 [Coxiella sp. (in: g-proteobacteria)]
MLPNIVIWREDDSQERVVIPTPNPFNSMLKLYAGVDLATLPDQFEAYISLPHMLYLFKLMSAYDANEQAHDRLWILHKINYYASRCDIPGIIKQVKGEINKAYVELGMGPPSALTPTHCFTFHKDLRESNISITKPVDLGPGQQHVDDLMRQLEASQLVTDLYTELNVLQGALVDARQEYGEHRFYYRLLKSVHTYNTCVELLKLLLLAIDAVDVAQHDCLWDLISAISTLGIQADAFRQLPRQEMDTNQDASKFLRHIEHSELLQDQLEHFRKLYVFERKLVNGADEADIWFQRLHGEASNMVIQYTSMKLIAANDKMNMRIAKTFILILRELQDVYDNRSVRWASRVRLRADVDWQRSLMTQLSLLRDELSIFMRHSFPGSKVCLLGGEEPSVYVLQREHMDIILRLYMIAPEQSNQEAIAILRKQFPEFAGVHYYSGAAFGLYEHCECAEYFSGGTLEDYITALHKASRPTFTPREQRQLFDDFSQLMTIMQYQHSRQCYYSDFKPSNFLRGLPDDTGRVTLMASDFKSLNRLPPGKIKTFNVLATVTYAAPEVQPLLERRAEEPIDPMPADYYALAMTFMEYVTGTTDKATIDCYQPRDLFETQFLKVLRPMLQEGPVARLAHAQQVAENIPQLDANLFAPRVAANGNRGLWRNPHAVRPVARLRPQSSYS